MCCRGGLSASLPRKVFEHQTIGHALFDLLVVADVVFVVVVVVFFTVDSCAVANLCVTRWRLLALVFPIFHDSRVVAYGKLVCECMEVPLRASFGRRHDNG